MKGFCLASASCPSSQVSPPPYRSTPVVAYRPMPPSDVRGGVPRPQLLSLVHNSPHYRQPLSQRTMEVPAYRHPHTRIPCQSRGPHGPSYPWRAPLQVSIIHCHINHAWIAEQLSHQPACLGRHSPVELFACLMISRIQHFTTPGCISSGVNITEVSRAK